MPSNDNKRETGARKPVEVTKTVTSKSIEKTTGAGPAIAEHSKDAKKPKK